MLWNFLQLFNFKSPLTLVSICMAIIAICYFFACIGKKTSAKLITIVETILAIVNLCFAISYDENIFLAICLMVTWPLLMVLEVTETKRNRR